MNYLNSVKVIWEKLHCLPYFARKATLDQNKIGRLKSVNFTLYHEVVSKYISCLGQVSLFRGSADLIRYILIGDLYLSLTKSETIIFLRTICLCKNHIHFGLYFWGKDLSKLIYL